MAAAEIAPDLCEIAFVRGLPPQFFVVCVKFRHFLSDIRSAHRNDYGAISFYATDFRCNGSLGLSRKNGFKNFGKEWE